ncbi:OmpA family protein [Photobacterium indicum]|jgi:OmpA-OmpF porin, OOP family|uniref:OmpA family protein n=1 Tax=Photobacterium indicum TaxID=81447 RepID=UPI003D0F756A
MKRTVTGLLALTLFGCSVTVEDPPIAEQSQDQRDFDKDGVINARDKCADTPHSAIVDNDGCPTSINREEENDVRVLFANDSTAIPEAFLSEIQRMADFLDVYPEAYIELKGYASPVGNSEYNIGLSKRRATKVREQLIAEGVAPQRIKTIGFGDAEPIAAESREATNTLSRRVVARVVGSKGSLVEEWTIFTLRDN